MKFLTYLAEKNKQPSFGFKLNDLIIDIRRSAEWINKAQGNEKFLTIEDSEMTVFSVWNLIKSKWPQDNIIVAINQEITDMQAIINPDDEVAFMPIFTGG